MKTESINTRFLIRKLYAEFPEAEWREDPSLWDKLVHYARLVKWDAMKDVMAEYREQIEKPTTVTRHDGVPKWQQEIAFRDILQSYLESRQPQCP